LVDNGQPFREASESEHSNWLIDGIRHLPIKAEVLLVCAEFGLRRQ
jgi:hypothetical protein